METHNRKRLLSAAYRFSYSRLVLNYYMFYESLEEHPELAGLIRDKEAKLAPILEGFLAEGEEQNDDCLTQQLDGLRGQNGKAMEILSAYGDCFSIYEYVLNRIERRFEKRDPFSQTPEEFVSRVLDSLSTSNDASILDSRMRSLVAQLPIRYTRQKFYGMVHDRLSVYIGADQKGLAGLFYMLRTAAMVQLPEEMAEAEPELAEVLERLKAADYRNLDAAGYAACRESFRQGLELFHQKSDIYLLFENIIDDLYVLLISRREAMTDVSEAQVFEKILTGVRTLFAEGGVRPADESLTESLTKLEGIQESAVPRLQFSEKETDSDLRKLERLLSDSPFVELEEEEDGSLPADRHWVDEKTKEFCGQLEELFTGMQKPVVRAVMASVLAQLPMMFRSVDELREYAEGSLLACTDFAEREACMEILERELFD